MNESIAIISALIACAVVNALIYRDWYVENFANMKEGTNNENEK